MAKTWNPETHPFVVDFFSRTDRPGMYGWESRTENYATRDEAIAAVTAMFKGSTYKATARQCTKTTMPLEWCTIASRKRGKAVVVR